MYRVTDLDTQERQRLQGKQLAGQGLTITVNGQPGSALVLVEKE
jgi:hypothetical protein